MAYADDEGPETRPDDEAIAKEPKSSKPWLTMIADAEKVFREWQDKADSLDKLYANLERLSSTARDRQFQLFWANIGVVGPAVYSRPPVPVVVPRFRDRRPLLSTTSELLERATVVNFEQQDIDSVMRAVRDDMTVLARGCAWIRYEASGDEGNLTERVCIYHVDRKDFLHDPAREWKDVDWVGYRAWLTRPQMRKRFGKSSGQAYKQASFERRKEDKETDDGKLKAGVWEIWCRSENKVVWVTEGVDVVLDQDAPHLTLEGFFPCPRPAYSTVQRRTLIPVPDMLFYKDQLEEINELTARIGALADAVKVRGFYPAGAGEIGDAIEAAVKKQTNNQVLIPISNWAMVGQGGVKDMIVWLPLDMIAETITQLVALRKQLIEDVYEITGLSDIMRGSTEASETATAQQLKSEYGSVRIRDRQAELVRFARDLARIVAEVMAENFQPQTLLEMSQMELPSDAQIAQQVNAIKQEIAQAAQDPETQALAQQNPQQAQQIMSQAQAQIGQLQSTVTIDQVIKLLRDQMIRPFALEIETDSTIQPNEDAQKQRATEFITAVGGFMNQAVPLVQMVPQSAPLMAETLKFVSGQYRAGRPLEGAIDEFADQMKQIASQPKPDPETIKAQSDAQATQADAMERQANAQKTAQEAQSKAAEDELNRRIKEQEAIDAANGRQQDLAAKRQLTDLELAQKAQKHAQDMDLGALQIEKTRLEIEGVKVKTAGTLALTDAKVEQANMQTDNSIATTEAAVAARKAQSEARAEP